MVSVVVVGKVVLEKCHFVKRMKKRNVVDEYEDEKDEEDIEEEDIEKDVKVVVCAFVVILLTHFPCDARCAATTTQERTWWKNKVEG
ncbi:hypothetical protein M0802_005686 [Mischocyttarus mexicanus]|nr:hypothetical protein M0802_005686 [Mischocyttarus mexicanus]